MRAPPLQAAPPSPPPPLLTNQTNRRDGKLRAACVDLTEEDSLEKARMERDPGDVAYWKREVRWVGGWVGG